MEAVVFSTKKGSPATDSRRVAAGFGKRHGDVLRAVREIQAQMLETETERNSASGAIFHPCHYKDGNGQAREMYVMNRAAFTLLVMGFTGKRALKFKDEYVAQFDRMEAELQRQRPGTGEVDLLSHTKRETQVNNSKRINRMLVERGGPRAAEAYNRQNCVLHTGRRPMDLKEDAKHRGVPARMRSSAKELLRHERPGAACSMSMADELVLSGISLPDAAAVTRQAIPVFDGLMRLGFTPKQLAQ